MKLRLTVDVEYDLNGTDPEHLRNLLGEVAQNAYDSEALTRSSWAVVKEWSKQVADPDITDLGTALKIVGHINHDAAYGSNPDLCLASCKVMQKLEKIIKGFTEK